MPSAPPRACSRCGKQTPTRTKCTCRPPWEGSQHPADTRQWQKLRAAKLAATPICEHPHCRRPATQVDHIHPLAEGGQRYTWTNLQSLCQQHHQDKTLREALRGKTRPR